jgi:hypothetical protein
MVVAMKVRIDVADIGAQSPSASDRLTMMSDYYGRPFSATCLPVGKSWQVNRWIEALARQYLGRYTFSCLVLVPSDLLQLACRYVPVRGADGAGAPWKFNHESTVKNS